MFKAKTIQVIPTLTVHATYVANDYVGTSAAPMEFALGTNNLSPRTGTIVSATLIDYALQSISTELWLFNATVTPPDDSAAWTISDADALKLVGIIPFTTYYASVLNSVSEAIGQGIGFQLPVGGTSLFGCLVTRGAPTYASGDVVVKLHVWED